jgi:hypothetical protein
VIVLSVDFNDLDEQGRVLALLRLAPGSAEVGTRAYLIDDEGNSCSGTIARVEGALIHIDANWDTWSRASDAEVKVITLPARPLAPPVDDLLAIPA